MATDDDIPSESTVVDDKVQDGWEESTVAHKKQHGDKTPPPLAKANGGARVTGANGKAARPPASTIRSAAIPAPPAMGRRGSVEARMTSQGRPAMQPPEQLTPPNAEVPQTVSNGTGPLAAQPTMIREPPMQGTATKPATQMARLVVIGGTDRGREFVLTKPETGVGRGTDNEIVLTDIAVSRRHFILTFDGRVFGVRDLGSGNGTILNGQRVGTVPVRDGDQIEIGNTLMRFEHPDGAAAQAPAAGVAGAPQGQQYPLQPPPQEAPYAPQQAGWASGGPPVAPPVPLPPGAQTFATQLPYGSFGQPPSMPGPPPGPATMQYSQPHQAYAPPPSFPEGTPAYDMSMSDPSATALRATQKKKMILGGVALMGGCILIAVIAALAGGSSSPHKPGAMGAGAGGGGGGGTGPVASAGGGAGGGTGGGPVVTPVGGGTAPLVTPMSPSPSASPLASPEPRPVLSPSASPAVVAPSPSPSVAPSPAVSPSPVKPSLSPSPSVKPSPSPLVKPSPSPVKPSPKPDKPKPSPKPDKPDKPVGDPEPIVSGKAKDLLKQSQAQYKARNFAAAAQSLRLAAEQQSGSAADKTRAQANQIAAIGEALTGAAGAGGAQAVKLYETALKSDAAVGKSAHAAFIKAKLIDAAKTEASKSIAAGKLENAYAYANMAEKYGGSGDPIVQKVRLALELKAKELYSKGQSSKGEAAKAAWRRILKIVPATSPWYQKAYTAVNAAPSGGVDEDEEQ